MILKVLCCCLQTLCFLILLHFINATVLGAMIAEPPETAAEPVRAAILSGFNQLIMAGRSAQARVCDIAGAGVDRRVWLSERSIP